MRRRYQKGSLSVRNGQWVGRWVEHLEDGSTSHRSRVLGAADRAIATKGMQLLSERQAWRALEPFVRQANSCLFSREIKTVPSFGAFVESWLQGVVSTMKPSSQGDIRSQCKRHLIPSFGDLRIDKIRRDELQQFVATRADSLSPKRIKNLLGTFRLVWKAARASGHVVGDPLEQVRLPQGRRGTVRFFTAAECRGICAAAGEPYRTMFWLTASTGIRAGELLGLRPCDVVGNIITINQSVWQGQVTSTKTTAADRVFPIGPALASHLAKYVEFAAGRELLFMDEGKAFKVDHLRHVLHLLCKQLGYVNGGLHALRHAQATLLDQVNAPMKVRQERMGHTDARLTLNVYTHAVDEDKRRVADEIDALLVPDLTCAKLTLAEKETPVPVADENRSVLQ